ncbi:MAG: Rrf2 family transcriptional regulator [Bacteroidales bacterium]
MNTFVNISEAGTIAIHSLALIAGSDELLNAEKIAERAKFSKHHLSKVMHLLVRHNYLESVRGPGGGYRLKKKPSDITLLELVELLDGAVGNFECAVSCAECYFEDCVFGNFPHRFTAEFRQFLAEKTLQDFAVKRI